NISPRGHPWRILQDGIRRTHSLIVHSSINSCRNVNAPSIGRPSLLSRRTTDPPVTVTSDSSTAAQSKDSDRATNPRQP
uniref:Uncharacterized protein n=1 Tax=Parascaris univalens TaxID=6257 RepID=A0A915B0R7_PARUN